MTKLLFEKKFRVNTYEADASGSLSVPGLFNFLQDAAANHATILSFGREHLEAKDQFWVLSRILVQMNSFPAWEEELLIRTWPRGTEGLFALRDYEIIDKTGKICGGATSCWIMVSRKNKRPVRPDKLLENYRDSIRKESALQRNPEKLDGIINESFTTKSFKVKYSDLDINMHVNNVQYIKWAIDAYPLEYILANRFESAEINYLTESLPGDEIEIKVCETGNNIFDHSVSRRNDNKELCRLRLRWINRQ